MISLDALNLLQQANTEDKDPGGVLTGVLGYGLGGTALYIAACYGSEAVVELLLKAKANPKAVNSCGYTPARVAESCGHADLARRLKEAEGKP